MGKRLLCAALAALLLAAPALAQEDYYSIERVEGERYFPDADDWTYHFTYAYPHVAAEDIAALMINDSYEMALDEMVNLILPMFANEDAMRFDGKNEIAHDFAIACNDGRYLSVLLRRTQTMGEETLRTIDAQVFDISGEYAGEPLTLRGVVMVGESSTQLSDLVAPVLYQEFLALQKTGVAREDIGEEGFYEICSPLSDFYANADGSVTFFFQPELLTEPTFDVPGFVYTKEMLEALLPNE